MKDVSEKLEKFYEFGGENIKILSRFNDACKEMFSLQEVFDIYRESDNAKDIRTVKKHVKSQLENLIKSPFVEYRGNDIGTDLDENMDAEVHFDREKYNEYISVILPAIELLDEVEDKAEESDETKQEINRFLERLNEVMNKVEHMHSTFTLKQSQNKEIGEISAKPGVYNFTTPSFFESTNLPILSKEEQSRDNYSHSMEAFTWLIDIFSSLNKDKKKTKEQKSLDFVDERKQKIEELINNEELTNEQKYLRYEILTPGIEDGYIYTLEAACRNGMDADVIIQLLEQPQASYNKKLLEMYVSSANKAISYDMKQEVIKELIEGKWKITDDNGTEYSLIPFSSVMAVKEEIKSIVDEFKAFMNQGTIKLDAVHEEENKEPKVEEKPEVIEEIEESQESEGSEESEELEETENSEESEQMDEIPPLENQEEDLDPEDAF